MNRYLSSFILTVVLYATAVIAAIGFLADNEVQKIATKKESRMCVSLMAQKKVLPKKKPKPVKKSKPNCEHKKKPLPKPVKEIVIKKPEEEKPEEKEIDKEPEEPIEKDVTEKEMLEKPQEEIQESISTKSTKSETKETNLVRENELNEKRESFLTNLVEQINKNKSYPKIARRRAIQGDVEVQFKILANGNVENIEIVSGRKVFKKSAKSAIENSFPMDVDTSLFDFPKEFAIKISYVLH